MLDLSGDPDWLRERRKGLLQKKDKESSPGSRPELKRGKGGGGMSLIKQYGEMWAKNEENIEAVLGSKEGGLAVYILYDGSFPVYVGKGKIRQRLRDARDSNRRGQLWDHFTWYALERPNNCHEIEAMLLRLLPYYLRILNRQRGKFRGGIKRRQVNETPERIVRAKFLRSASGH